MLILHQHYHDDVGTTATQGYQIHRDLGRYAAGSSHQEIFTLFHKGTWSLKVHRWTVVFKHCSVGPKGTEVCQENVSHTITPPPAI